jgi:phosphoribosylglycinamide formyltransferase-1
VKTKLAIFASGGGTNAEHIIGYFKNHKNIAVGMILSNNKDAFVLKRALKHKIPQFVFDRDTFYKEKTVDEVLKLNKIDLIVLAGFMWLIPQRFVKNYPNKIVNIHPALLPKYGGKGMYGHHVHEAVVKNKEKNSGITIHWVNEAYDEGAIIYQATCAITPSDTPEDVANKVHQLEYEHYPRIIEQLFLKKHKIR